MSVMRLSRSFLKIINHPSIHRLQLGFVNDFIAPIELICVTNLNVINLRRFMRDILDLKWCSKWAANESYFCPFLRRR